MQGLRGGLVLLPECQADDFCGKVYSGCYSAVLCRVFSWYQVCCLRALRVLSHIVVTCFL